MESPVEKTRSIRVAVDAMGGDFGPSEVVKGCVEAIRGLPDVTLVLVGDEASILRELTANGEHLSDRLTIVHTTQMIEMCEPPVQAVRTKKDSSINRGMELLRDKKVDAFLSAGSTGAMVAAAMFIVRRSPAVKRPAIATALPTVVEGRPVLVLDAGANSDCTPVELEQFAIMGKIYSEKVIGRIDPSVGLLSIGTEDSKGNELTKKTLELLKTNRLIHFLGNVEGHDLFRGDTDVVVCDGFVGNVVLKTTESLAKALMGRLKDSLLKTTARKLAALLLKPAFKEVKKVMDPDVYGGAPLLGVNGTVIITHGAASHRAIFHAIRVSAECASKNVADLITHNLALLKDHSDTGLYNS